MKYLRILVIWLTTIMLSSGLSLLFSSWIFNATLADSNVVKNWLSISGVYDGFVDEVADSSNEQIVETGQTIDTVALQKAANQAFPPGLLQTSAESLLDGMYNWLDGSKDSVEFTLDFSTAKSDYSAALAAQAQDRILSLPDCNASQLATLESVDLFSLPCAPPESVYQPAIANFQQQILNSEEFLEDPIITASDVRLPLSGKNKSIESALPFAPIIYQLLRLGVLIASAMILLSIGVLLLISRDKLAVLRRVAKSFFASALTAGLFTAVMFYVVKTTNKANSLSDPTLIERITNPLLNIIADDLLSISVIITWIYLVIATACYVTYRILVKRRHQAIST